MNWENHLIKDLQWSNEIINREAKERVAREIAATAKTGDVIGAGSGSTVYLTLFELAKRIHEEHLYLEVIPASQEISMTCIQLGIPQTTLWDKRPDWTFDGKRTAPTGCLRNITTPRPRKRRSYFDRKRKLYP